MITCSSIVAWKPSIITCPSRHQRRPHCTPHSVCRCSWTATPAAAVEWAILSAWLRCHHSAPLPTSPAQPPTGTLRSGYLRKVWNKKLLMPSDESHTIFVREPFFFRKSCYCIFTEYCRNFFYLGKCFTSGTVRSECFGFFFYWKEKESRSEYFTRWMPLERLIPMASLKQFEMFGWHNSFRINFSFTSEFFLEIFLACAKPTIWRKRTFLQNHTQNIFTTQNMVQLNQWQKR